MNLKSVSCIAIILLGVNFISCTKAGTGGKVELVVTPKHHSMGVPDAMVYIKYNTQDFPGEDVSKYDDSGRVVLISGSSPNIHFKNIRKGNYFIYSVGYDSTIFEMVMGGVPEKVTVKSGEVDVDVAVTH
ncbi:MAG: hypothetical protein WCI97_08860 [Bacteroidota bacterium]